VKDGEGRITGSVEVAIEAGDRDMADEIHNLRSFSKMLIDLQEEERRRIALDLHDQVGQSLTTTKLYLRRIERECKRTNHPAMREFADAISLIDAAVNEVRNISQRLRPPTLDILGLVPSLSQLVKSVAEKSGVEITFTARGIRGKIDARIEIALYRVVQEALNNALKYSGCTRIDISLRGKGAKLSLQVVDNGKGFAPLRANRMTGLGLTGMRERIEGVGGTFGVKSGPGEGTRIEAIVPTPAGARRTRQRGVGL
jgi:signal transduction histidine kinase